jgi:hypothetical protein
MKRHSVHLRLFRTDNSDAKNPRYAGTLLVPGVPLTSYNVQAWLEEVDSGNGTGKRKCLAGFLSGRQELRGAKIADEPTPAADLLTPLEDLPFDDSLDGVS